MSWRATAWAKGIDGITRSEKLLLLVLADYYNDEAKAAWPSTATLAKDALMTKRHVIRLLDSLEAKGVIQISRTDGRVSRYHLAGDMMSPVTFRAPTGDIAMSPKQTIEQTQKKIRERYEQVFVRTPDVRRPLNSPDKYFAKFTGDLDFDPQNIAAVIKVAEGVRGARPERLQVPPLAFWPNLDRVGAFLRKENGKLNRNALYEAFDAAFVKVVGSKGGEGWDNILDGVAQAPEEFFTVYREVDQ